MSEECKHDRLHFASGGFYIVCHGCYQTWVALKPGRVNEGEINYDAGGFGLFCDLVKVPDTHN